MLIHEVEHIGPGAGHFACGLSDGPEPGGIDVRVPDSADVVGSDVGGYIAGVLFGTHPMAPAVSPKKSWEGFVGSLILSTAIGVACVTLLLSGPFWVGLLLGPGLACCATLGDLVESQFKRDLGIKDMSGMLPGHGGLMDRLDGMLPSAMITWVVLNMLSGV